MYCYSGNPGQALCHGRTETRCRGVVHRETRCRRRTRIVEGARVGDFPGCEVHGVKGVNGQFAIAQGHRAMFQERLEQAGALVVLAHLVEVALEVGVVPAPSNGSAIGIARD